MTEIIYRTNVIKSYDGKFSLNLALYICDKYDLFNLYRDNEKKIYFDTIAKCASILSPDAKFDVKEDDNYNYSYIIRYDDKINFELDDEDEDEFASFEEI